jgi:RND family efflux transporter MFP subunit
MTPVLQPDRSTRLTIARRQIVWLGAILLCSPALTAAEEFEGFTEPFRVIDVAAAEMGIIDEIEVREGDRVGQGDVLATLDKEVLEVTLRIAAEAKSAQGQLASAAAELRLRTERLERLTTLRESQHATEQEVIRAVEEKEVAEGNLLAIQEALEVKALEYQRIQAQLERRNVRSPADGVVTQIYKDAGEFVAPTDPIVLTVVQLDPLFATFSIPAQNIRGLKPGGTVTLRIGSAGSKAKGTLEFVSPVINAQSGTVTVKVKLANSSDRFRSGERCKLVLTDNTDALAKAP